MFRGCYKCYKQEKKKKENIWFTKVKVNPPLFVQIYKNPIIKKSTPRQNFCVKPGLTNTFFSRRKNLFDQLSRNNYFSFPRFRLQNNLNGLQMMTSPPKHCMSSIHVSDFCKNCANFYLGKHDVIPEIFS